jgi:Tetracyclin repressor-like, C-terminal domain
MTARFPKTQPQVAKIIQRTGFDYLTVPSGLAPRARRDLQRGQAVGRFSIDDLDVALACAAGALLGVLHLTIKAVRCRGAAPCGGEPETGTALPGHGCR